MSEKNSGSVLLYVLFAMSILMLLGSVFLSYTLSELRISQNYIQNMQAYYAAEAGMELVLSYLSAESVLVEGGGVFSGYLGDAHYETEVETWAEDIMLTSRGFAGTAVWVIRGEVIREETTESEDTQRILLIISTREQNLYRLGMRVRLVLENFFSSGQGSQTNHASEVVGNDPKIRIGISACQDGSKRSNVN